MNTDPVSGSAARDGEPSGTCRKCGFLRSSLAHTDRCSPSAARDGERPQTVGEVIRWVFGPVHQNRVILLAAALGLDPDTVLDGKLIVLHPGQHVVEFRKPDHEPWLYAASHGIEIINGSAHVERPVVVASGPAKDAST